MTPVFDSNIVIDLFNGWPQAKSEYERYGRHSISIIAVIEVLAGLHDPGRLERGKWFLKENFAIIALSDDIAETASAIRRQNRRLKLPDAVIWATAMQRQTLLITRNSKDFPADDPTIRIPYQLNLPR